MRKDTVEFIEIEDGSYNWAIEVQYLDPEKAYGPDNLFKRVLEEF